MKFEVKWVYWDEENEEKFFEGKEYGSLMAATDRYEHMKNHTGTISASIAVIIEEFSR